MFAYKLYIYAHHMSRTFRVFFSGGTWIDWLALRFGQASFRCVPTPFWGKIVSLCAILRARRDWAMTGPSDFNDAALPPQVEP
jgi:hypothetical protein